MGTHAWYLMNLLDLKMPFRPLIRPECDHNAILCAAFFNWMNEKPPTIKSVYS
jgi:hypothetical protein